MNSRNLLYSFVFLSGFIFSKAQFTEQQILNADEAFVLSTSVLEDRIFLSWDIKPGYYLYKKSILIKSGDEVLDYNYLTKYESKIFDEFFGESTILKGILMGASSLFVDGGCSYAFRQKRKRSAKPLP